MKDLIIPHLLRDRIIMNIDSNNKNVPDSQKEEYIQEIFDTYFELLDLSSEKCNVYCLYFSIITNYDMPQWIIKRIKNKQESKVDVYNFIRNYALSQNTTTTNKVNMSNLLSWRFNQHPDIQDKLNRLVFVLSGKTLEEIKEEIKQLND